MLGGPESLFPTIMYVSRYARRPTTVISPTFYTKNDRFTKTGSGQTQVGETQKTRPFFLSRYASMYVSHFFLEAVKLCDLTSTMREVRNTPFLRRLYTKKDHFTKTGSGQT